MEFALISVLLFTLVFGIITFGMILSFQQDLTRAAAEGARAGAVAFPASGARDSAVAATNEAVSGFGQACGGVLTCDIPPVSACSGAAPGGAQCVRVALRYDYGSKPLVANLPLMGFLIPKTLTAESVARVNT